ncbi:MAG: galactosyltransferase-related protein [Sulfuricaulis sp.]|nr:galactosyltransferase-related protein [Sulfuricaulis sp.]
MITICFTYFKSLSLANLAAALHSVYMQDLSSVASIILLDNDTGDDALEIQRVVDSFRVLTPRTAVVSLKHGDPLRTHSWSANAVVRMADTPWILFTRADYLLHFDLLARFAAVRASKPEGWDGFIVGNGCHLHVPVEECERTSWRIDGAEALQRLPGSQFDYTVIDSGVWMARREAFDRVGGLDESLTAWGHAQTHFQHKLFKAGAEFVRIPEVLFWHPAHGGHKDIDLAHAQLRGLGVDIKELWARYEGAQPYR